MNEKVVIEKGDSVLINMQSQVWKTQVRTGWYVPGWQWLKPVLLHMVGNLSSELWFPPPLCPPRVSIQAGSVQPESLHFDSPWPSLGEMRCVMCSVSLCTSQGELLYSDS